GKKPPLVPPLAQLKLLKAMQGVVNGDTLVADREIKATKDSATKSELQKQVQKLGQTQKEIHQQAVDMIESLKQQ
ncbi:MAG: hypothetical protein WCJ97_04080, partial [Phycisphaerae bacterium]